MKINFTNFFHLASFNSILFFIFLSSSLACPFFFFVINAAHSTLLPNQFMLYTCPLFLVSFCAVHPTLPNHFGFVAQHPASDTYFCYLFRSKKFVSETTKDNISPCCGRQQMLTSEIPLGPLSWQLYRGNEVHNSKLNQV